MNCKDQNLLLLSHGALNYVETATTVAHLFICPSCRAKYDHLRVASVAFERLSQKTTRQKRVHLSSIQVLSATGISVSVIAATIYLLTPLIVGTLLPGIGAAHPPSFASGHSVSHNEPPGSDFCPVGANTKKR